MKNKSYQPDIIIASCVILVHIGIIAGNWQSITPPKLDLGFGAMDFVDLSSLSTPDSGIKPSVPKPPIEPPKPKEKPKQKPHRDIIKPVVRPVEKPDIVQPEPIPIEPEPPEPVPETTSQSDPTPQDIQNNEPVSAGGGSVNEGGKRGNSGSTVGATHIGGYLNNPKPPYPNRSREEGEEGSVGLEVVVTEDGRAAQVTVIKSSGYARLDRSAKHAVEKYRFKPSTRDGIPVESVYRFSITFSLRD